MKTNVWTEHGGDHRKETLRRAARTLNLLHQPPADIGDWHALRRVLRKRIQRAAGTFPPAPELDVREHGRFRGDGYRVVNLTYQSRLELRVTANLYVPEGTGPFPAVLNVHGHWLKGKAANRVFERCHTLAAEGFVVLSVDAPGSGERGTIAGAFESHGRQIAANALSIGETLLGLQVCDNMRGIDFLQSLDFVRHDRIGVTGASGGGNQTMWLSALDPRVRAAVPVVSVGTFEAYVTNNNCWCETLPDGLKITEEWALLAMMAPKPLLVLNALGEDIPAFQIKETARACDPARSIYRLMGAEDRFALQTINLPHGYFPEMQRHMLGWFKKWLCGEGGGWPRPLPPAADYPEGKLFCFPAGQRPTDFLSLNAWVSNRAGDCRKDFLRAKSHDRTEKIRQLRKMLRVPGISPSVRASLPARDKAAGLLVERFSVEAEPGVLIPCCLIGKERAAAGCVTLAVQAQGKDACLSEPVVQELLRQGSPVCVADLRDTGETLWDGPEESLATAARSSLWLGRTMLGNWVCDLSAVRRALAARCPAGVELLGIGEAALAVLAAAALDPAFSRVTVDRLLASYATHGTAPVWNHSIFVPGMLRWGDVSLLGALARCPLHVRSLVHPGGEPLTRTEAAAWRREVQRCQFRLSARKVPPRQS